MYRQSIQFPFFNSYLSTSVWPSFKMHEEQRQRRRKEREEKRKVEQEHREHQVSLLEDQQLYPFDLPLIAKKILDDFQEGDPSRLGYSGLVSPDAWKLSYGETKVFEVPPRQGGQVIILVDMSGSMDCWLHQKGTRSYLALSAANLIAKAVPGAKIYGFAEGAGEATVVPIPVGFAPDPCEGVMGGATPICSVLMWLEEQMAIENALGAPPSFQL